MEVVERTSLFLTEAERRAILESTDPVVLRFRAALARRVTDRLVHPGLVPPGEPLGWWYPAAEYLSDAAMQYALEPTPMLGSWLRAVTLDIAGRPTDEWVGPAFRSHAEPLTGHLETAHVCWGVSAVLSLAPAIFSEVELFEVRSALREKGLVLCGRWLAQHTHLANWRGILASGALVAAAALGDEALVQAFTPEVAAMAQAFQPDGSYAESLQYGNYLANALMLAYEALFRLYPDEAARLDVSAYSRGLSWIASSMFYARPLPGWSEEPVARAANFNDSAAIHRPSGDLLLHLAVRSTSATERGLARWLFDTYYTPVPDQGPHDLATFGMRNDWGFLTLPLLTRAGTAISPQQAGLPLTIAFSNGNAFVRDAWEGKTIVAINGGGEALYGPGHLHGDLNSFILVHRQERLLVDPGHSCYRNLIHGLESSSQTHNTCTFLVEAESLGLQEDLAKATLLEQKSVLPRRQLRQGIAGPPIQRGSRFQLAAEQDVVSVVGAEAAAAYGGPIRVFRRFWLRAGSHVLFVVDQIEASRPVTTVWNWLVNNRDGRAQTESKANCLTVRRNGAGMKLFHTGPAKLGHPVYGYVHDAYHVEPDQPGEGRPGSGLLYRWTEPKPLESRTMVHAIALDAAEGIGAWTMTTQPGSCTLTNGQKKWTLEWQEGGEEPLRLVSGHGRSWHVRQSEESYQLIPA